MPTIYEVEQRGVAMKAATLKLPMPKLRTSMRYQGQSDVDLPPDEVCMVLTHVERAHFTDTDPKEAAKQERGWKWKIDLHFGKAGRGPHAVSGVWATEFHQGSGHKAPPTMADVMGCLLMDAGNVDQPFEEWAWDYGYDPDSRKAEKVYEACRTTYFKLRQFLGADKLAEAYDYRNPDESGKGADGTEGWANAEYAACKTYRAPQIQNLLMLCKEG